MNRRRGDLQDGWSAYERKDYETAHRLILPLAEQGNADAQFNLGLMYHKEHGVPQDHKEAVKWFRLSAEQGFIFAEDTSPLIPDVLHDASNICTLLIKLGLH